MTKAHEPTTEAMGSSMKNRWKSSIRFSSWGYLRRTWLGVGLGSGLGSGLGLGLGYLLGRDRDLLLHLIVEGIGRPDRPRLVHVALAHLQPRVRVGR